MSQATRVKIGASRLSGMSSARRPMWWRSLVAADVLIVAAFAVVATVEPYHVLGSEGVEIQGFQGLLPTIVALALRAVVVAGERYLLPVPHGPMMVACARLASLTGFFYIGRWLYERRYSRWDDFLLGGVLGYALVGVAALGLVAFGYSLTRLASAAPRTPRPPADAGPPPGDVPAAPDTAAAPSASPRRGLARDSPPPPSSLTTYPSLPHHLSPILIPTHRHHPRVPSTPLSQPPTPLLSQSHSPSPAPFRLPHYIDSTTDDVSEALRELGGASVVLATAGNAQAMADTVGGLGLRGELVAVGVTAEPLPISPVQLISPALSVTGHPSGTARDIEETMHFAVLSGVRARIEQRRPLARPQRPTTRWSKGGHATAWS